VESDTPKLPDTLVNQQHRRPLTRPWTPNPPVERSRPALLAQCPFLLLRPTIGLRADVSLARSRLPPSEAFCLRSLQNFGAVHVELLVVYLRSACGFVDDESGPLWRSFESFGVANQDAGMRSAADGNHDDMGVARPSAPGQAISALPHAATRP